MAAKTAPVCARMPYWLRYLLYEYRDLCPEGFVPYVYVKAPRTVASTDPAIVANRTIYIAAPTGAIEALVYLDEHLRGIKLQPAHSDEKGNGGAQIFVAMCADLSLQQLSNALKLFAEDSDVGRLVIYLGDGIGDTIRDALSLVPMAHRISEICYAVDTLAGSIRYNYTDEPVISELLGFLDTAGAIDLSSGTHEQRGQLRAGAAALVDVLRPFRT